MYNQLSLYKAIYPPEVVERAIQDYEGISKVILMEETDIILTYQFMCKEESFKLIRNEFCNYLIALRNAMRY